MPFTLAHPAVVLPLSKLNTKWLYPSALILGSMAPDFEYFLRLKPYATIGHMPLGFILLNLPICFLLYFIWTYWISPALIEYLPKELAYRLANICASKNRLERVFQLLLFSLSALLGMATHVFWDSFTHDGAFFVTRLPNLNHLVLGLPIYKYLQHGSTCLGFAFIFIFIWRTTKKSTPLHRNVREKTCFWSMNLMLTALFMIALCTLLQLHALGSRVIAFIDSGFLALLFTSMIARRRNRQIN